MSKIFLLFLLLISLENISGDKLLQIQTVFRHGARAPEGTYKNDPYQADTWPWGWAELTTVIKFLELFILY